MVRLYLATKDTVPGSTDTGSDTTGLRQERLA
jgi:hypothetical protein